MQAVKGTVYLVGAGPGDPELLTVRALRLLETADVVLHDDLVPDAIISLAKTKAVTSVGKRCGQARITQQGINMLLVEEAQAGKSIVRLKSGDPMVFGRAAEELQALREANVPVEVVPGISAVFAAAATMQTPMTDRRTASKLVLVAGHHADGKEREPIWKGTLPADVTLAIYMPGRDFNALADDLHFAQVHAETPIAAISKAATPQQRVDVTRLKDLAALEAGPAPLLVLVGAAMESLLQQPEMLQQLVAASS